MQKEKKVVSHTTPDWELIKTEYLSTKISLRKLSEKYSVPITTLQKTSKREGWIELRKQIEVKSNQKTVENISDSNANNTEKAMNIINILMEKAQKTAEMISAGDVYAIKQMVGTMKELKDLGVYQIDNHDNEIVVVFEDEEGSSYAD